MRSSDSAQDDGSALQSAWMAAARGEAESALAALQPVLSQRPDDLEALDFAISMLEDAGRLDALCGLLERRAALPGGAATRAAVLVRLGAVHEEGRNDPISARLAYQRALRCDPDNASAREGLARNPGTEPPAGNDDARTRAQRLEAQLGGVEGASEIPLHLELAGLYEDALDDRVRALGHLRRAVMLAPLREDLLERALALAREPLAQLDLLEDLHARTGENATRAKLLARRGDLLADRIGWPEEAAESWRASLEIDPQQTAPRERLSQA